MVTVLMFPPHCSHEVQPRERSVKGSLTTNVIPTDDVCITKQSGTAETISDILVTDQLNAQILVL